MFRDILELFFLVTEDFFIIGGLIGFLLYVFGLEKAKRMPSICWILNVIVKIILGVLVSV